MTPAYSIDEVAARYGMTRAQVVRRCRRDTNPWPHLRPNRRDASTWRFTDKDIADIDNLIQQRGPVVDSWGREKKSA